MSDAMDNVRFFPKVVINKQKTKVLFAEIDSHFADVLLSFLTLPLGTIVQVINEHRGDDEAPAVFGSITTLYNGLSNLYKGHFTTRGAKLILLNPSRTSAAMCRRLKLDIGKSRQTKYLSCDCPYTTGRNRGVYTLSMDRAVCLCGDQLSKDYRSEDEHVASDGDAGVFTLSTATFVISDDLQIFPNETTSFRKFATSYGINDLDGTELRIVNFGFKEIVNLLRSSLISPTPLTDVVLKKQTKFDHPGIPFSPIARKETSGGLTADGFSARLKVTLQKSTQKLLFVEADEDFTDFLFSLLVIPLGGVECLLGSNTCLENIDNLYRGIETSIDQRYLRTPYIRTKVIKPKIPLYYLTRKLFFSLVEEYLRPLAGWSDLSCTINFPKDEGSYVEGPRMYMVKDDLTVKALCMASYLSTLNELKIPLSDVDELVLHIGLEEALGILKASLTSTCALSNGLNHLLSKELPMKEQ